MVPLLISPAEWARLEAGLIQRTTLLNLILADLYGPQTLLAAGLLPPSLVFSNPAFLRPCHGIRVPHGIHLHLHAVDLARSPDGQWWVLADRTQAPSGAGYALENRIVLLAQPARNVPRLSGAAPGLVLSRSARHADGAGAAAARPAEGRAADARAVQRNLFRARLSRALSRLHARRRRRSDGARPPRLHQDARRPPAGRRHLSPPRRQFLRSARAAQRLVARRGGPGRGGTRRQRRRSPTRSARA